MTILNNDSTHACLFHRKTPDFMGVMPVVAAEFTAIGTALLKGDHPAVLNRFFDATNSVENRHWLVTNPTKTFCPYQGVNCEDQQTKPIGQVFVQTARSTSIGDVIVIGNSVYRLTLDSWQLCSAVNALDFIWRIRDPHNSLEAATHTLADRYQTKLSFGYIGNCDDTHDDRSWMVFYQGPRRTGKSSEDGWGRFETAKLPLMADRAKTVHNGKSLLENWVASKAGGDATTSARYADGNITTPQPPHA